MSDLSELSESTLNALKEFLNEQNAQKNDIEQKTVVPEDWNLSQFWYTQETADILARQVLKNTRENSHIACLCAPTLFKSLLSLNDSKDRQIFLFEFDRRFGELYGENFVFYDYRNPQDLINHQNGKFRHGFDMIFLDPPFLSQECFDKVAELVEFMKKTETKIIVCSGEVMGPCIERLFNAKLCSKFQPQHSNKLANEFRCFVTYGDSDLLWFFKM